MVEVVVVLSMPRSGTSLLTSSLHRLGGALPDDLLGPHHANPDEYFESEEMLNLRVAVEEELKIDFSFPSSWAVPDWDKKLHDGSLDRHSERARRFFAQYEQRSTSLACTRFRRHRVRCFDGTGGASWSVGSSRESSSLRLCG